MRVSTADITDLLSKLAVAIAPTVLLVLFGSGGLFALQRHRRQTGGKSDARKGFEGQVTDNVTALQEADTGHRRFESTLMKQYQDLSGRLDEDRRVFNDKFADAEQRHVGDIAKLKAEHKADIARLAREHEAALAVLKEAHATAIRDMEKRHAAAIDEMQTRHAREIAERDRTIKRLQQSIAHLEQAEHGQAPARHPGARRSAPSLRALPPERDNPDTADAAADEDY